MEIRLLGSLEVLDEDRTLVPISGTLLQALLTLLALRCGEVVADDVLVAGLWGDEPPARSPNALQRQVSTLRRVLGGHELVQRRGAGYVLTIDKSSIDIYRFELLAARGQEAMREGDPARARDLLAEALQLWRGEALANVAYEQFAQLDVGRLTEARLVATETRIDADLMLGGESSLVGELEQLVTAYPLREHLRAQLMLALARSGRQAEALRSFQSARAMLAEELGVEPSQELRELDAAILQQDEAVVRPDHPSSAPRTRTNLRTPLTTMVGRGPDLDALRPILRAHRLATLVGPGGVGKSRLAIEAAREWLESGSVDVWFVELAEVADPDEVVSAIMSALELPRGASSHSDFQRLTEFLNARDAVVVLDNCEHLIASAARVAQRLLESCPRLKIWATSREGLAIPGEVLWPVSPLSLEDAVALFIERGRAANPATALGTNEAAARTLLDGICLRLDGLPLAIELAAARLRAMPITELAAGLEDRFRLLNRGARTALPRQQTLRAVVDWSYDLLFDDERRVFERLSVFGGAFTLAAARAVCADSDITSDDVTELVTRLAEKSLLQVEIDEVDGYARCWMLQTLVDYGRERLLASGELASVYASHVRYYADFATRSVAALRGEKQRNWLRAVAANMSNLRVAFDAAVDDGDAETACGIAGSLGWYWWFTGRAVEGARWLARARSCAGTVERITHARVLAWTAFTNAPGFVHWAERNELHEQSESIPSKRRSNEDTDELSRRAIALYREVGALAELASVEAALAITYSTRGNHKRVLELLYDAHKVLGSLERTPQVVAMSIFVEGRLGFVEGRYADAEKFFRASVDFFAASGAQAHCAFALRYVGRLAHIRNDQAASIAAIEQALELARALGLSGFVNVLTNDLGESVAATGNFDRARDIFSGPLTAAREVAFLPGVAESLTALALLEWRAANDEVAAGIAREALDAATAADNPEAVAHCCAVLGLVAERAGDVAAARAQHLAGLEHARRSVEPRRTALALEGLARVAILEGDGCGAARLLGAASVLRHSPGSAAGSAFAATSLIDTGELVATAARTAGFDVVSRAFAEGTTDPELVVASMLCV